MERDFYIISIVTVSVPAELRDRVGVHHTVAHCQDRPAEAQEEEGEAKL